MFKYKNKNRAAFAIHTRWRLNTKAPAGHSMVLQWITLTYLSLITFWLGCLYAVPVPRQVLESFKIMDYSLLLGIHVLDRKPLSRGSRCDSRRGQKVLYSTALESIQGTVKDPEPVADDETWAEVLQFVALSVSQ